MCHMEGSGAIIGAAAGGIISIVMPALTAVYLPALIKVSQIFADNERECQEYSFSKLAYKIAKWSSLVFAAIAGTLGALSLGLGVGLVAWIFADQSYYPTQDLRMILAPVGIITTIAIFEFLVIKNVWQQAVKYNQS